MHFNSWVYKCTQRSLKTIFYVWAIEHYKVKHFYCDRSIKSWQLCCLICNMVFQFVKKEHINFIIHYSFKTTYICIYASSAHTYRKQITVKTWLFLYLCMLFYLLTNVKHALTKGYELKIADIMTFTVVCEENKLESLWPIQHW